MDNLHMNLSENDLLYKGGMLKPIITRWNAIIGIWRFGLPGQGMKIPV